MNENFLQDNPLKLFDDFVQIPDQAFEDGRDITEINSLIETIMNSEDFVRVLVGSRENNPAEFNHYDKQFAEWVSQAKKNVFGTGKKKEMILSFMSRCMSMFDEIKQTNGYFQKVPVKFCKVTPDAKIPTYSTIGDAGADIYANEDKLVEPGQTIIVPSGVKMIIPGGYRVSIVPRSGMSLKTGIFECVSRVALKESFLQGCSCVMTLCICRKTRSKILILISSKSKIRNTKNDLPINQHKPVLQCARHTENQV